MQNKLYITTIALFTVAKIYKQFKHLSLENYLNKLWSTIQWNIIQPG